MEETPVDRLGRCFYGPEEWKRLRRRARIRRAVEVTLPFARLGFYVLGAIASIVIVVVVVVR